MTAIALYACPPPPLPLGNPPRGRKTHSPLSYASRNVFPRRLHSYVRSQNERRQKRAPRVFINTAARGTACILRTFVFREGRDAVDGVGRSSHERRRRRWERRHDRESKFIPGLFQAGVCKVIRATIAPRRHFSLSLSLLLLVVFLSSVICAFASKYDSLRYYHFEEMTSIGRDTERTWERRVVTKIIKFQY